MKIRSLIPAILIALSLPLFSQEEVSLDLTIYSNNFGVIRNVRSYNLNKGMNDIKFSGIPRTIIPQSIFLKFDGQIVEQSFRNDLERRDILFGKLLNKKVILKKSETEQIKGELLSFNDGFMIKTESGDIVMISDITPYQLISADYPKDLVTSPGILWKLSTEKEGSRNLAINYLFDNISWRTDYVALLNEDETKMDLDAKFTLTNNSGFDIKNASTNLVSGNVNKISDQIIYNKNMRMYKAEGIEMDMANQSEAANSSEDLSDYQIYYLKTNLNLENNETKQLEMFSSDNIKMKRKKRFKTYGTYADNKVTSLIYFKNDKESGLGRLLPKGKIGFYKNLNGKPEFLGENNIPNNNINDSLEIYIGDVLGIIPSFTVLNSSKTEKYYENDIKILLTNRTGKDEEVEIYVGKDNLGSITKSSVKLEKVDAYYEKYTAKVPKNSEFTLSYTLRNIIPKP